VGELRMSCPTSHPWREANQEKTNKQIVCFTLEDMEVVWIEYDDPRGGAAALSGDQVVIRKSGCYVTSLILMGYGVKFCQALANINLSYIEDNLADNVAGFGVLGKV
jgi:hypothetical protein